MSEFIIDMSVSSYQSRSGLLNADVTQLREEIVRCRDCIYYKRDPSPIDPGWPMMCADSGRDMLEPYGYCAWGERKEGDE